MRFFATLTAAMVFAGSLWAASAENTLMIEVAGHNPGVIEIELLPDVAPKHVERIKQLARDGAYDNVVFHRVIAGFMAQTGDVQNGRLDGYNASIAGTGGSKYPDVPAEFSDIPFEKGVVGMARSQSPNSANSQFFIMFKEYPSLNNNYTVFGRVSAGQKIVDKIKKGSQSVGGSVAQSPDYMKRVWIKSDE
jgi:cyclophilin family peptidyl-prolyl cis-trans isomerase